MRRSIPCLLLSLLPLLLLAVTAQPAPAYVKGQRILLSAQILDELGNPIPGIALHFEDETDNVYLGHAHTDASGIASVIWDTSSTSTGLHTIHVWNAEHQDLYVEESHSYLQLYIMAPAILSYSVQAPGAVKPGESFTVVVTVENLGEAGINDVVVSLGGKSHDLGSIEGGDRSKTSFNFIAPRTPGEYGIQGSIHGREQGTGYPLQESFQVDYRVKVEGFGISIITPSRVGENEHFDFSIRLSNIGEDSLEIDVEVTLIGATPTGFSQTVRVPSGGSKTLEFSATAGMGDFIVITATGTYGSLQESDQVNIAILHPSKLTPSLTPTSKPSQTNPPSPPTATQSPSSTPCPSKRPLSPQLTPKKTPQVEEPVHEPPSPTPSIGESFSLDIIITGAILILFSFLRRIWKVEQP